jgi:hypothetical protein
MMRAALRQQCLCTPGASRLKTQTLRMLQQPSHIDGLLRSLVKSLAVLPDESNAVTDPGELPSALQRVVAQAIKAGQSWMAWQDVGVRVWLFVAEMSLPLSRERGSPVLEMRSYREDGLKETANWLVDRHAHWQRCIE